MYDCLACMSVYDMHAMSKEAGRVSDPWGLELTAVVILCVLGLEP